MNKPADNPAEPFKKALAEANKTMANARVLNGAFSSVLLAHSILS